MKNFALGYVSKSAIVLALTVSLTGCGLFSSKKDEDFQELETRTTAIGVNGYLWQATLDTLSFMPMDTLDPAAGAIVTEWYSDPSVTNERIKIMIQFMGNALRSDGLNVTVNRQVLTNETWVAAPVQASTKLELEEAILVRARELRIGTAQ